MTDITQVKPTILGVEVNWWKDYANAPELVVKVDDAWHYDPHRGVEHYEIAPGLWFGVDTPWAHFVYDASARDAGHSQSMRGQCQGNLNTNYGPRSITSGWSSRAGVINSHLDEVDHVMDVVLKGGQYSSGRAGIAVFVDAIRPFLPDDVYLVAEEKYGTDLCYTPSTSPTQVLKP